MSGSAALSAARKRRASGAPLANNSAPVVGPPYYSKGATIPENIPYPLQNGFPPQQMNIYENIELIKQQLAERTKLIQMQAVLQQGVNFINVLHAHFSNESSFKAKL